MSWKLKDSEHVLPRKVRISGQFNSIMTIPNLNMFDTGSFECITKDYKGRKRILVGMLVVYGKYYSICKRELGLWSY